MYEVSISTGRLMTMRVAIAVLLILVIVLFLKLRAEPGILPDVVAFQKLLSEETSRGATLIDITGKVTPFDFKLRLVEKCGVSEDKEDTRFPANCLPEVGSVLLFKNVVTLMVYGNKEKDLVTDVILGTGDPTYFRLPPPYCSDGTAPPC